MSLIIVRTSQFKKDFKRALKRGFNIEKLKGLIELLLKEGKLPQKYRDHILSGEYKHCRECHIQPDWLLIYCTKDNELILIRTGTHADLFE